MIFKPQEGNVTAIKNLWRRIRFAIKSRTVRVPEGIRRMAGEIKNTDPGRQAISYDSGGWIRQLPGDPEFFNLDQQLQGSITRSDVIHFGRTAIQTNAAADIRKFFMAVMIWGYGGAGYGPYRTKHMLSDPNFTDKIRMASSRVNANNYAAALQSIKLKMCGPIYASKFLYFASEALGCFPSAVIIDSRVVSALEKLAPHDLSKYVTVHSRKDGAILGFSFSPEQYAASVVDFNCWAAKLGCKADCIELALFQHG